MFPDMLAAVAMWILMNKNTAAEACNYFGCEWLDLKAYVTWLNGPPSLNHYSRITELFLWFAESSINTTLS
jgi:hypothetical protein